MNYSFFNEEIKSCLNRNSASGVHLGDDMEKLLSSSNNRQKLIPVVGTQGMGKSTLINAILGENILPNDADETTCVPVEVAYGEREYAQIEFHDRRPCIEVNSREELNAYVDNNENPANKKGVNLIRLYRKRDILKSGLIIVDLPGVGSITMANEETTKRYIENVNCALFVIPINPTIRRTEAMFIKAAWAQFVNAIFVENDFGETELEKREGTEHNTKILDQISRDAGLNFERPILIVNAYKALVGGINANQEDIKKSGISALTSKISDLSEQWDISFSKAINTRIHLIINSAISVIAEKEKEENMSQSQLLEQRQAEYAEFKEDYDRTIEEIDKVQSWLLSQRPQLSRQVSEEVSQTTGYIRARMTKLIDGGAYDGDRLNSAFQEIQTSEVEDFSMRVSVILENFAKDFSDKMHNIEDLLCYDNNLSYNNVSHNSKKSLKWEKGLEVLCNIGGGAAGFLYGGAVAAFFVSNPAGWAVAVAGIAIYGLASLLGFGVKKGVQNKRKNDAKKAIYPKIEEIGKKLKEGISEKVNELFKAADSNLEKVREKMRETLRIKRRTSKDVSSSENYNQIESDRKMLESVLNQIS